MASAPRATRATKPSALRSAPANRASADRRRRSPPGRRRLAISASTAAAMASAWSVARAKSDASDTPSAKQWCARRSTDVRAAWSKTSASHQGPAPSRPRSGAVNASATAPGSAASPRAPRSTTNGAAAGPKSSTNSSARSSTRLRKRALAGATPAVSASLRSAAASGALNVSSTAGIDGAAGVSERRLKAPMGVILRRTASQCAASVSCAAVTTEAPAAKRTQAARAATLSIVRVAILPQHLWRPFRQHR